MINQIRREVGEKKYNDAERDLAALRKSAPHHAGVPLISAAAHVAMHRYDAALADCNVAIGLLQENAPNAVGDAYEARAEVYLRMGNPGASRADFERAVSSNKKNPEYNNALAWLLATSTDAAVRNGPLAVRYATTANALSGTHDAEMIDTLAAAEAEAGDFDLAAKYERQALTLFKAKETHGAEKRLSLFEKHQPFRFDPAHSHPTSE